MITVIALPIDMYSRTILIRYQMYYHTGFANTID